MTKPPFPYYGGKQRIAPRLVDLFPEHRHYVEPFFGGGSVLLAKEPSVHETVNDIDGRIVGFWRAMRDTPVDLERVCSLTPHSREELVKSYDRSDDKLEDARRVFVMLTQGRGATTRTSGWRNVIDPASNMPFTRYLTGYVARMEAVAERLKTVSLENRDALDVIERYGRFEDVLLYVDPPYLRATRNSTGYAHEADGEEFHTALLNELVECKASVVISGYPSEIYERALVGWERHILVARANTGARTEVVWVKDASSSLAVAA